MSRPLRVQYPGALYHVLSRGNRKGPIYKNDPDRVSFLNVLSNVCETHNWMCYGYCLMKNHYHLLIETPDPNLSIGMRDLNGTFTQNYNWRHKTVGHLLQGRFKAHLIEKETYLLAVARYIVLNPVRAGYVDHPSKWLWSSYSATCGTDWAQNFLYVDQLLSMFGKNKKDAQNNYEKFVLSGIAERSPFADLKHNLILGSPQFVHETWEFAKDAEKIIEIPKSERIIGRPGLNELFNKNYDKIKRNEIIKFARMRCGYSITEIAKCIGLSRTMTGIIIRQ